MEHPFFATNATPTRAEAQRWLTIAEKLLSTRDLMGSKSFASRARESDPTLSQADQILAVADTLLAGDIRIGNNSHDWYSILRITPAQGRDSDFVATQYRNLALLLNPQTNNFAFADQAFRLVIEAWSVLSNPSRKNMYDSELAFLAQQQQQQHDPFGNNNGTMPLNFMLFGNNSSNNVASNANVHVGSSSGGGGQGQFGQMPVPQNYMNFGSGSNVGFGSGTNNLNAEAFFSGGGGNVSYADGTSQEQVNVNMQQERQDNLNVNVGGNVEDERGNEGEGVDERESENDNGVSTFWTACPYCYHMFEYPRMYVDCCLKCEICKRAFQGVVIPSPPPVKDGDKNFCCFGFMPLGFSTEEWEKNEGAVPAWSPFSPLFATPKAEKKRRGPRNWGPRVYFDDDDAFVDLSDSDDSDDGDWRNNGKSTKRKANGKGSSGGTAYKSRKKSQVDNSKNVRVQNGSFPADNVEMLNKTTVESSEKGPTPNNATGEPSKKDFAPHQTTGGPSKKSVSGATPNTIARKQPVRGAKSYSRLDLNMECNNEAEEPAIRMNPGNGLGRREDENVEGIGFFEGLDEFLSNLPILNAVDDDKAIKA